MSSSPSNPLSQSTRPAPESDVQLDLLTWFEKNRQLVIGVLTALIVLVVGKMVWTHMAKSKEVTASEKLLAAFPRATPGSQEPPAALGSDALLKLVGELQGTKAGERATLMAGGQLYSEGKYAEAKKQFDAFIQAFPNNPFAQTAKFGSAASLDAMNQVPEALAAYQDIATRLTGQSLGNQAKIAMARIHESKGDFEKALNTYDDMIRAGMFTPVGQQASMRKNALLSAHPELNKPASMTNDVNVVNPSTLPAVTIPAPAK